RGSAVGWCSVGETEPPRASDARLQGPFPGTLALPVLRLAERTTNESPAPGAGGAWSLGDSTHWSVSRNSVVIAQQFSNLFPGAIQRPYFVPTERLKA